MDAYKECLVKREITARDRMVEKLLLGAGILCIPLGVFVTPPILAGAVLFLLGRWVYVYRMHLEFEYTLVESSLRIDAIYSQRRRKAVGEYSLKKVQAASDSADPRLERLRRDTKVLDYSSMSEEGRTVSLFLKDTSGDRMELRISPDESMYKMMWRQIPTIAKNIDLV